MSLKKFLKDKVEFFVNINGFKMVMVSINNKIISSHINKSGLAIKNDQIKVAHNGVYWMRDNFNKDMEKKAIELECMLSK